MLKIGKVKKGDRELYRVPKGISDYNPTQFSTWGTTELMDYIKKNNSNYRRWARRVEKQGLTNVKQPPAAEKMTMEYVRSLDTSGLRRYAMNLYSAKTKFSVPQLIRELVVQTNELLIQTGQQPTSFQKDSKIVFNNISDLLKNAENVNYDTKRAMGRIIHNMDNRELFTMSDEKKQEIIDQTKKDVAKFTNYDNWKSYMEEKEIPFPI